jgi:Uma2 family endonuclease
MTILASDSLQQPLTRRRAGEPVGRLCTPEQLLAMSDGVTFELDDGRLVRRGMGIESSWIAGELYGLLRNHCSANKLGWVFPADASYQCWPEAPMRVRKPDVSFIPFGRLPNEKIPKGHCPVAPDLAVEVLSPHDRTMVMDRKIKQYFAAGVRLVWTINPELEFARVHRPGKPIIELPKDEYLDGEEVVPGFRCRIGDLLQPVTHSS